MNITLYHNMVIAAVTVTDAIAATLTYVVVLAAAIVVVVIRVFSNTKKPFTFYSLTVEYKEKANRGQRRHSLLF